MTGHIVAAFTLYCFLCQHGVESVQELGHEYGVSAVDKRYVRSSASGSNCGLYAAVAALKAVGAKIEPRDYMRAEFISNVAGSSAFDLIKLVETNGYRTSVIRQLNGSSLYFSNYPIIVHLDGSRRIEKTNHWVTFLGIRDGKPLIFDPPHAPEVVEFGDILAQTSGVGIMVFPANKEPTSFFVWVDKAELTLWIMVIVFALYIAKLQLRVKSCKSEFLTLVVIAVLVTLIQQLFPWSSLISDSVSLGHYGRCQRL